MEGRIVVCYSTRKVSFDVTLITLQVVGLFMWVDGSNLHNVYFGTKEGGKKSYIRLGYTLEIFVFLFV